MTTAPTATRPHPRSAKARKGIHIGPTKIPKWTLGWQILGWTREYLLQPDGPNAGEPWVFTDEQALFLLNWYAVDRDGRFVYRYGMLRRMKGWGKDPFAAALCCIEFIGPCRFGGWENGQAVAIPHSSAWIQIAAVAREQTKNTMTLFPGMLSPKASAEYEIDVGKEIIYAAHGQRRIEAVTSSPRALEGGRPTFTLKNESHHWLKNNEGHAMSQVIARNAAKSRDGSSRVLAISNAHSPGEDSDAEHDWEAWQKISQGVSTATGFLYDSLEAPGNVNLKDDASVMAAILAARGDSVWLDAERLLGEIRDPRTPPATARRYYFDQLAADEDRPFDVKRFERLARKDYTPAPGALIALGFDGSRKRDNTDLIATEVATGFQWVYGHWEPKVLGTDGELWIDGAEVEETVTDAFARYDVGKMFADPYYWQSEISVWEGRWGDKIVKFPTNSYRRMAVAVLNYRNAIETSVLSHDGDPRLVGAIANSHKQMHEFRDDNNERMFTIQKERSESPLKIDAAVAGVLSWAAREDVIAGGGLNTGEAGVFFA